MGEERVEEKQEPTWEEKVESITSLEEAKKMLNVGKDISDAVLKDALMLKHKLINLCDSVNTMRRMTLNKTRDGHYEVSASEYDKVVTKAAALTAWLNPAPPKEEKEEEVAE
jgi:hypothetical protein